MANRESYLRFLSRMGKTEEEALPLWTEEEEKKLDVLALLLKAINETR